VSINRCRKRKMECYYYSRR